MATAEFLSHRHSNIFSPSMSDHEKMHPEIYLQIQQQQQKRGQPHPKDGIAVEKFPEDFISDATDLCRKSFLQFDIFLFLLLTKNLKLVFVYRIFLGFKI